MRMEWNAMAGYEGDCHGTSAGWRMSWRRRVRGPRVALCDDGSIIYLMRDGLGGLRHE